MKVNFAWTNWIFLLSICLLTACAPNEQTNSTMTTISDNDNISELPGTKDDDYLKNSENSDDKNIQSDGIIADQNVFPEEEVYTDDDNYEITDKSTVEKDSEQTDIDTVQRPTMPTCPENDKFCHKHDFRNWSDISTTYMKYEAASAYCKSIGGRIPLLQEVRLLIQNCAETEIISKNCGLTANSCSGCPEAADGRYSVFGDIESLWTSSGYIFVPQEMPSGMAVQVGFYTASFGMNMSSEAYFRCVK